MKTLFQRTGVQASYSNGPRKETSEIVTTGGVLHFFLKVFFPSKVFCRILLKRVDSAIDHKLREEQAGFRRGRRCTDQVFALRNITLYIFINFTKAFDSVHRENLWKILRAHGIPPKIIQFIGMSGLRQGCILSPLLFLIIIDWVMHQTTSNHIPFFHLEELDFTDEKTYRKKQIG
ncbi:hypothetical protein H4Q32_021443 [Labeo rohita]|uniref:Reverse transcriptase domain-containing protein n=1 Tax=Labeo rohita TaxID=84645 RepID=A0ABQ8MRK0_LABRO|nr:hypothetical protein H4Q32_021443 [Labeo rohita]